MSNDLYSKLNNLSEKDLAGLVELMKDKKPKLKGTNAPKSNQYQEFYKTITHIYNCSICGGQYEKNHTVKITAKGGHIKASSISMSVSGCPMCEEFISTLELQELRCFVREMIRCLRRGDTDFSTFKECI